MTNQEIRKKIFEEVDSLLEKKNHDYGDSAHKAYEIFGPLGHLVRMTDKVNRAVNLAKGSNPQVNESLRETIMDLLGYTFLLLTEMDREDRDEDEISVPGIVEKFIDDVKRLGGSIGRVIVKKDFVEVFYNMPPAVSINIVSGPQIAIFEIDPIDFVWRLSEHIDL